jgi:hypothetical protein
MKKAIQEKHFELQNLKSDFQIAMRKNVLLEQEDRKKVAFINKMQNHITNSSQLQQNSQRQEDAAGNKDGRPISSKQKNMQIQNALLFEKDLIIQNLEAKIKNMEENNQVMMIQ